MTETKDDNKVAPAAEASVNNEIMDQNKGTDAVISLGTAGVYPGKLEPLPAVQISNVEEAGTRLGNLKTRANFLCSISEEHSDAMVYIVGCLLCGPIGLCLAALCAQQKEVDKKVSAELTKCIEQINVLRDAYQSDPSWESIEANADKIRPFAFILVDRKTLKGSV